MLIKDKTDKEILEEVVNSIFKNKDKYSIGEYKGGLYYLGNGMWGGEGAWKEYNKIMQEEFDKIIKDLK